jgi:preprotein translocase subunit SecG
MVTLITVVHIFVCIFLMLVVLLQAGKGGGMGVAFGSATSSAVFGGRGAGSFLEKLTAITAIMFMVTSMSLAWYSSQSDSARLQRMAQEKAAHGKAAKAAGKGGDKASPGKAGEPTSAPATQPGPVSMPDETQTTPAAPSATGKAPAPKPETVPPAKPTKTTPAAPRAP